MESGLEKNQTDQIAFLHILRAIAILLVLWAHLSALWLLTTSRTWIVQQEWQKWIVGPFHVYLNGGHLAVILFFLVSGFIITHTSLHESYYTYFTKRTARIFPVLFVATVVAWLIAKYGLEHNYLLTGEGNADMSRWIRSLFLLDGFSSKPLMLSVTWTLFIEICFYFYTFVLLGYSRKNPYGATWVMIGLYIVSFILLNEISFFNGAPHASAITYIAFLIIGRSIYLWYAKIINGYDATLIASTSAFIFILFIEKQTPGYLLKPGGWVGIEPLATYVMAILVFLIFLRWSPKRTIQPLRFFADISYSLYLFHVPIGMLVLNISRNRHLPFTISFISAVGVSVLVSYISYRLIEMPTRTIARNYLKKHDIKRSVDTPKI